jgi:AraC family transcriptional regulator, arabinose operon regulatory protein
MQTKRGIPMKNSVFPIITEEESRLPFYVKSIGLRENQEYIFRPSGYTEYHWLHSARGKGKLLLHGREHMISEGMGFFFHPGIPHEYYAVEEPWETHWVTFDGQGVRQLVDLLGFNEWGVFHLVNVQLLERLMNELHIAAQSANAYKGFDCSALLYRFLIELKSCITLGDNRQKSSRHELLQPVITYIEEKYQSEPTLEEMAQLLGVTPQHLCRIFKQVFNMRPFVYLTRFRLQKAKEFMIDAGDLTIREIARNVGYNDASYFCSLFREYEGLTPMEFKRMHRMERG